MRLTKKLLEKDPDLEGAFKIKLPFNGKTIDLSLEPDDVTIDEVLTLANRLLDSSEQYEKHARDIIVKEFLGEYNTRRADNGLTEINEQEFNSRLELSSINLLSSDCIDFFYSEDGMFGNHTLIAQTFDGINFNEAIIFG